MLNSMSLKLDLYVHKAMEVHVLQFAKLIPKHHRQNSEFSMLVHENFTNENVMAWKRLKAVLN